MSFAFNWRTLVRSENGVRSLDVSCWQCRHRRLTRATIGTSLGRSEADFTTPRLADKTLVASAGSICHRARTRAGHTWYAWQLLPDESRRTEPPTSA